MTRQYIMRARAASADATRQRVLAVVIDLLRNRFRSEIRLEEVADRAEVSVQTVLNIFGSRSALLETALADLLEALKAQRLKAAPGDISGGISALIEHYEAFGDLVIRNLAEQADRELIEIGRAGHRQWVQRQFSPFLDKENASKRRRLVDSLVCACDVYTWKLLRRDLGRSRAETEATIRATVEALLRGK